MIDELDQKLIHELQRDGRKRYVDLARILGVAEATVRKRIKSLVSSDIMKLVAVPNMSKLGYKFVGIIAFQVRLADLRRVADELAQKPQICYLAFCTGRYDLIGVVITRSPEELALFIENEISAIESILRTETFVNLDIIKGRGPLIETNQLVNGLAAFLPERIVRRENRTY